MNKVINEQGEILLKNDESIFDFFTNFCVTFVNQRMFQLDAGE
jgi:hypothetical protein